MLTPFALNYILYNHYIFLVYIIIYIIIKRDAPGKGTALHADFVGKSANGCSVDFYFGEVVRRSSKLPLEYAIMGSNLRNDLICSKFIQ
jgi:hypothetical protein